MERIKKITGKITLWEPPVYVPYAVYIVFLLLFFTVSCFHEPWLDEAQAWLIARDASYHDIIFTLPHYEGHPPLWWMILSVPAKLNMPYELSLTIVSIMISAVSVYLIIFKSPFCAAFRLTLPFTFFIFYQYGIIARPYSLLILSFIMAALFYKGKNEKPFRFTASLLLMCLSSGYGMVFAGSIALVWCIEITSNFKTVKDFISFFKTSVFLSLFSLLICAVAIALLIIPAEDTFMWSKLNYEVETIKDPGYLFRGKIFGLVYMLFLIPADSMMSSGVGIDSSLTDYCSRISILDSFILLLPSICILVYFICLTRKKGMLKLFIIPYSCFAVFSDYVYFNRHHLGIITLFFVFLLWICKSEENVSDKKVTTRFKIYEFAVLTVYITINLSWSSNCIISDIKNDYDYGKAIAEYIINNNLQDKNILTEWRINEVNGDEYTNTNAVYFPVSIAPYFEKNIFINLNCGNENMSYVWHKESDTESDYKKWSESIPDILIGQVNTGEIYGDKVKISYYYMAEEFCYKRMWKTLDSADYVLLYRLKNDTT